MAVPAPPPAGEDIHSNAGTLAREVAEQRRALLSIQQSAASESALWGWPLMEHYCSWDGVHCDGRAHVIRLCVALSHSSTQCPHAHPAPNTG